MSELKLPDFMQKYIDYMEDGHKEMYRLAREYYDKKSRFDNNLGAGGPNNQTWREGHKANIERLEIEYKEKALSIAKTNGYKEPEPEKEVELTTEEKKAESKENAVEITESTASKDLEEQKAKFIADLMSAKERSRDHNKERER